MCINNSLRLQAIAMICSWSAASCVFVYYLVMKCLLSGTFTARPQCSLATRCNVSYGRKTVVGALSWLLLIFFAFRPFLLVHVSCTNASPCKRRFTAHLYVIGTVVTCFVCEERFSPPTVISSASLDWLPLLAALLMPHKGPLCEAPAGRRMSAVIGWFSCTRNDVFLQL